MRRALLVAIAFFLGAPALAADVTPKNLILLDLDHPLHFNPPGIASQYANSETKRDRDALGWTDALGWADVSAQPIADPRRLLAANLASRGAPTFVASTSFEAEVFVAAGLRKVKRKLLVDVAAYDADDVSKRWEGLEAAGSSKDESGKTLSLNDGRIRGDFTLGVGASAGTASVGDVLQGEATYLDLNPLRDVSAQFDFLFRTSELVRRWGFNVFVIRLRAAYKGAFNGVNSDPTDDDATESEFTLSFGVAW
jgi:hypothetical protein